MSKRKKTRPKFLALVQAEMEARAQAEVDQQAEQGQKENPRG